MHLKIHKYHTNSDIPDHLYHVPFCTMYRQRITHTPIHVLCLVSLRYRNKKKKAGAQVRQMKRTGEPISGQVKCGVSLSGPAYLSDGTRLQREGFGAAHYNPFNQTRRGGERATTPPPCAGEDRGTTGAFPPLSHSKKCGYVSSGAV